MNPTHLFQGQVALITGAGSGIGVATGRAFATAGAAVVLADVNEASASAAADETTAAGHQAIGVGCDVADEHRRRLWSSARSRRSAGWTCRSTTPSNPTCATLLNGL